jgi:hypothetical protein
MNWRTVDWDKAPIDDEHRMLAGYARDDAEFYATANLPIAMAIERYLDRYSRRCAR